LLARRLAAEFVGTALLLLAVVGSGIAAQRLSPNDVGLELMENSIATGAALAAIILAVGPMSGAHLNPAVSLADRLLGGLTWRETVAYWVAQVAGGTVGTVVANLMFSLAPVTISTKVRSGPGLWLAEVVATFGLLLVVSAWCAQAAPVWPRSQSAPTSPLPTGSPRQQALPTRR